MKTIISGFLLITAFLGLQACAQSNKTNLKDKNPKNIDMTNTETITLGSGCFWCTEAIYQRLEGVVIVAGILKILPMNKFVIKQQDMPKYVKLPMIPLKLAWMIS